MKRTVLLSLVAPFLFMNLFQDGGAGKSCEWANGYMKAELYWVGWKSIPSHTRSVQHVISSSAYFYQRRKFCLYRISNGAELDSLITRTQRHPAEYVEADNTVVMVVQRSRQKDTISFVGTKYVTINKRGYHMSRELFVFVAKQMPFFEASRMLQDTVEFKE